MAITSSGSTKVVVTNVFINSLTNAEVGIPLTLHMNRTVTCFIKCNGWGPPRANFVKYTTTAICCSIDEFRYLANSLQLTRSIHPVEYFEYIYLNIHLHTLMLLISQRGPHSCLNALAKYLVVTNHFY